MTHSILLTLKLKSYEDVKEIKERILEDDDENWMAMFGLRKVAKGDIYPDIYTSAKLPPFICFPESDEREEDGLYHIIVESGSHCSFTDTKQSFMMWVSWFCFIKEVESYGIDFTYGIGVDGERGKLNLKQALSKVVRGSELTKFIKVDKGEEL